MPICPDFATYFKRTTQAVQRCKNQQQRCSYGRDRVGARRYVGGVCDLTGEVGRVAVAAATRRDAAAVDRVYATDLAVLEQLSRLPLPPKLGKKIDPLNTAVKKVEHLRYELALAAANPLALKRQMAAPADEPESKRVKEED